MRESADNHVHDALMLNRFDLYRQRIIAVPASYMILLCVWKLCRMVQDGRAVRAGSTRFGNIEVTRWAPKFLK